MRIWSRVSLDSFPLEVQSFIEFKSWVNGVAFQPPMREELEVSTILSADLGGWTYFSP